MKEYSTKNNSINNPLLLKNVFTNVVLTILLDVFSYHNILIYSFIYTYLFEIQIIIIKFNIFL